MEEVFNFIRDHFTVPLYLVVWIVMVLRYRIYADTPLKYFPIYIMYTFLTELLGYFITYHDAFQFFSDDISLKHNVIIYNIYALVTFLYFYDVYIKVVNNKKYKKWIKIGAMVCGLSFLISLLFQDPLHTNLYYAEFLGSLILIMAIGLYFKEKTGELGSYPKMNNIMFWTSMGLAIFYIFFPFIFLIGHDFPQTFVDYGLNQLLMIVVVVMHTTFVIGALAGRRRAFR